MDEILIEEKKYVSSKRAAKITGYAKDYIGQLCREGRVPARLVGRSWYVLESAIQDHRFGDQVHEKNEKNEPAKSVFSGTWETPRYESSVAETIPPVNRLRDSVSKEIEEEYASEPQKNDAEENRRSQEVGEERKEEEDVPVPIHTTAVHETPQEGFLPEKDEVSVRIPIKIKSTHIQQPKIQRVILLVNMVCVLIAGVLAAIAVISTGYFDDYISKIDKWHLISGINIYNK